MGAREIARRGRRFGTSPLPLGTRRLASERAVRRSTQAWKASPSIAKGCSGLSARLSGGGAFRTHTL